MIAISYASFGRRLWAFVLSVLLDLLVLGALAAIGVGDWLGELLFAWVLLHHVGFVAEGGTLGHRLAGLRVVRAEDGQRVQVVHAALRLVVEVASILPLGLGVLWMFDEPQLRTWHDLAAGTVVVRERRAAAPIAPAWAVAPPWWKLDGVVEGPPDRTDPDA